MATNDPPASPPDFLGRRTELGRLLDLFRDTAERRRPSLAVIVGESGTGKTRLAQAVYQRLTTDPDWDPAAVNYWPDAFQGSSEALRVTPDFKGHCPSGPPRFLWLGARWFDPDRPLEDRACPLPNVLDQLAQHQERWKTLGSVWTHLASEASGRLAGLAREGGLETAVELTGIPGLKLALEGVDVAQTVLRSRWRESRSDDRLARESINAGRRLARALKSLLGTSHPLPTVLFLDDAQWIDHVTVSTLGELFEQARSGQWPLLVLATHHAHDWHRDLQADRRLGARGLAYFAGHDLGDHRRPDIIELADVMDVAGEILVSRLPGLTPAQRSRVLEKSATSLHALERNIRSLQAVSHHFVDRDPTLSLSASGERAVDSWRDDARERATQRFLELPEPVKDALAWGSGLGRRFMLDLVTRFARRQSTAVPSRDVASLLDGEPVLTTPGPGVREFRDRLDFDAAITYLRTYLPDDATALQAFFDETVLDALDTTLDRDAPWTRTEEAAVRNASPVVPAIANLDDSDWFEFLDAITIVLLGSGDGGPIGDRHASIAVRALSVLLQRRAETGDTGAVATLAGRLVRWHGHTAAHAHLGTTRRHHLAELLIAFDELEAAETLVPSPLETETKAHLDSVDRMILADILRRRGRVDEAMAMVEPLLTLAKDDDERSSASPDLHRLLAAIHEQRGDYLAARDAIARSFELANGPQLPLDVAAEQALRMGTLSTHGEDLDAAVQSYDLARSLACQMLDDDPQSESGLLLLGRTQMLLGDLEYRWNGPNAEVEGMLDGAIELLSVGFDRFRTEVWLEFLTDALERRANLDMHRWYRFRQARRRYRELAEFVERIAGEQGVATPRARAIRCRGWVAFMKGGGLSNTNRLLGLRARPAFWRLRVLHAELDSIHDALPESERLLTRAYLHFAEGTIWMSMAGRRRKDRAAQSLDLARAAVDRLAELEPRPDWLLLRTTISWYTKLLTMIRQGQPMSLDDELAVYLRFPRLASKYWFRAHFSMFLAFFLDLAQKDGTWRDDPDEIEGMVVLTEMLGESVDLQSHYSVALMALVQGRFNSHESAFSDDQKTRLRAVGDRARAAFAPRERLKRWVRSWFGR